MKRRGFLGAIIGLFVAPFVKAAPTPAIVTNISELIEHLYDTPAPVIQMPQPKFIGQTYTLEIEEGGVFTRYFGVAALDAEAFLAQVHPGFTFEKDQEQPDDGSNAGRIAPPHPRHARAQSVQGVDAGWGTVEAGSGWQSDCPEVGSRARFRRLHP